MDGCAGVSIHAPAWGATGHTCDAARAVMMFQSTHPRGVRQAKAADSLPKRDRFNPRTRVGCDGSVPSAVCNTSEFQSTHPRGVRRCAVFVRTSFRPFQSTHPRGVRPHVARTPPAGMPCFNPRTRVGCDQTGTHWPQNLILFQSTHPRGVRPLPGLAVHGAGVVSIHAPAWGATLLRTALTAPMAGFQSTHPRGVRHAAPRVRLLSMMFQSTHPRGVRQRRATCCPPSWTSFNPRTRVGCDLAPGLQQNTQHRFQSTHPRGVRLLPADDLGAVVKVSIHAPAWGATWSVPASSGGSGGGFNPRTRVGCDRAARSPPRWPLASFNPRTRVGCDWTRCGAVGRRRVSIHAPAWGATWPAQRHMAVLAGFNPRTRVGCDLGKHLGMFTDKVFQSTHPRGVRPARAHPRDHGRRGFNPRTRVGCDDAARAPQRILWVFQSTHPRGVRLASTASIPPFPTVSIHAPAWGATADALPVSPDVTWFQSTHPRGVRLLAALDADVRQLFQSTHPRGVRRQKPRFR